MALVLEGDSEAADLFVLRFSKFIWAILVRHMQISSDDAEEIYQEVFVRLWEDGYRRLRTWSGRGDLASWLAPLVRHLASDHFRKSEPEVSDTDREGRQIGQVDPDPEVQILITETRAVLQKALMALPDADQELLRLRFFEARTYKEIAGLLQITVSNVGVRLSRVLERLRSLVSSEYPDLFPGPPGEQKSTVRGDGVGPSGITG